MVALTFAAVPLYRLYVKVTGYGGLKQSAAIAPGAILKRTMTVQFDSNVASGLPWTFKPLAASQTLRIGELGEARFRVQNNAKTPVTAAATFNVLPFEAASYFRKVQCFCYTAQTLAPGEARDFAVSYFIDPRIAKDRDLDRIKSLTLSYTFFRRDDLVVDK